jgi:hypothetical protein
MKKLTATLLLLALFAFEIADIRSIYTIPLEANAVCTTDYDLDGDLDIVINHGYSSQTQWGGITILGNDGYGHFSLYDSIFDRTGEWNIKSDTVISKTYPDVLYHSYDSIVILTTDGTVYSKYRFYVGPKVNKFDLGDIDNNGYLDVVFLSNLYQFWGVIYNQGDGSFGGLSYYYFDYTLTDVASKDLNGDGRADIVIVGAQSAIYFSTEAGFEIQPLQHNAGHVRIADMDNDGDEDIITFSDLYIVSLVHLYENIGDNTFDTVNDFYVPDGSSDFLISDFNNDSLPDAIFLTYDTDGIGYVIFYNQGNFQFGEGQVFSLDYYGEARRFMYCADMDGNGYTDILITRQVFVDSKPSYLEILFNDGNGNFVENPLTTVETPTPKNLNPDLLCYPNPFKDRTTIEYTLGKESTTDVSIYSLNGQKIKTLNNKLLQAGKYTHTWNGMDKNGKEVSSGIYLAVLQMNERPLQAIKLLKQ